MRAYEDEEVDDGADSGEPLAPDSGGESGGGGLGQKALNKGADVAKDKMKDKAKEKLAKDAAQKVAAKGSLGAALGPIIFWVGIIIVALIIIIGIIMFFITMPGMVMEKLKEIFGNLGATVAAFFGADTTVDVDAIQVFETLDYMEEMGYDLKGYGFLTGYYEKEEDLTDNDKRKIEAIYGEGSKYEDIKGNLEFDDDIGVVRDKDSGRILLADADYIFYYIVSDNYVYTLKNENLATIEKDDGFFETLLDGFHTFLFKMTYAYFAPIYELTGLADLVGEVWGKGMLALYYEGTGIDINTNNVLDSDVDIGALGVEGDFVNLNVNLWNWDMMKVDTENKQLIIAKNSLFNSNNPLVFNLDGWTGRYGMPLEFLLSVHASTMMPDLAYDMSTTFPTEVKLYLKNAKGEVQAIYKSEGNKQKPGRQDIVLTDLNKALTGVEGRNLFTKIISWFDNFNQTEQEVRIASKMGVDHVSQDCDCVMGTISGYKDPDTGRTYVHLEKNKYYYTYYEFNGQEVQQNEEGNYYYINENGETVWVNAEGVIEQVEEVKIKDKDTKRLEEFTSESQEYQEICDACREHLQKVISYSWIVEDTNYQAYLPYIANVTNHWYRDVYFVLNENQFEKLNFVDLDYDYESVMKERWTQYETDEYDEFKLYVIDERGRFAEYSYKTIIEQKFLEIRNAIEDSAEKEELEKKHVDILNRLVEEPENGLLRFKGTKEETQNIGFNVAKKAITLELDTSNTDVLEDLGWNDLNFGIWAAYKEAGNIDYSEEKPAYDLTDEDISLETRRVMSKIYTKVHFRSGNVVQTGEGIRTETNPKIKRMFLSNTYFRYDGNQETAEVITKLRNFIANDISGFKTEGYGPLNLQLTSRWGNTEDFSNAIYDADGNRILSVTYDDENTATIDYESKPDVIETANEEDKTEIFYVKDYSGQVTLNQDSLNAFSMLENTHTIDADYIYRDFKELVVELGYFEKEELTDETPRILQWIVPDTGSDGYPDRTIDKRENEIGSMIHSEGDIDANKVNTLVTELTAAKAQTEGEDESEEETEEDKEEIEAGIEKEEEAKIDAEPTIGASFAKRDEVLAQFKEKEHGKKSGLAATVTVTEFLSVARAMGEEMNQLGYDYCVGNRHQVPLVEPPKKGTDWPLAKSAGGNVEGPCSKDSCDCSMNGMVCNKAECNCPCCANPACDHVHDHACGLAETFAQSKEPPDNRNVCCDRFVYWVMRDTGLMDAGDKAGIVNIANYCLEELGGTIIEKFDELEPGDIMIYVGKNKYRPSHIDILGERVSEGSYVRYNGGHYASIGVEGNFRGSFEDRSAVEEEGLDPSGYFTEKDFNNNELCFGIRILSDPEPGIYEGYHGNEAVVSPVTGILLEYGTYEPDQTTGQHIDSITGEEYRVNVDLKYGPLTGKVYKDKESLLNGESEDFVSQIVSDKVGYAKILVLDTEYYQKLEANTENSWKNDSLVDEYGQFHEGLESTDDKTAVEILKDWSDLDKLVYGYKEFAECYKEFGIAGYTIYIDGFICEEPDPTIPFEESRDKIPENGIPLEYQDYKDAVTTSSFNNVKNYSGETIATKYEADEQYKLASQKATEKLEAEIQVKVEALSTMYLEVPDEDAQGNPITEKITFIKEGTVLGRTMTDKELIKERVEAHNASGEGETKTLDNEYKELRPSMVKNYEKFDSVIGNYVRIIMRDLAGTPVENVEDYMKLDEVEIDLDWELFYWLPFESGGQDLEGCGPESYSSCSEGEVAAGCIQETELVKSGLSNITTSFIPFLTTENPALCAPLLAYAEWTPEDFWNDWNSGKKEFGKTLSEICDVNREEFFRLQIEEAKVHYYEPLIEEYPWVEDRPKCVQAEILHYKVWTGNVKKLKMDECEKMSDEEILLRVRWAIANTGSTVGPPSGDETTGRAWNEPEIGLGILAGKLNIKEVEEWVRTKDTSILTKNGIEWRSSSSSASSATVNDSLDDPTGSDMGDGRDFSSEAEADADAGDEPEEGAE